MFKKYMLLGASLITLLEAPLYAGAVHSSHEKDIASKTPSFELGLTALYLQAYSATLPTNSISINTDINLEDKNSKAPWNWGGILEGRYYISDNNDLSLNWMHYDFDFTGIKNGTSAFTYSPETGVIVTDRGVSTTKSNGTINLNTVNAEIAHSFDLSSRSLIRLSAGAQYLNVTKKSNQLYQDFTTEITEPTGTVTQNLLQTSYLTNDKYQGGGPRIGLDARYKLKGNFSLFANSAATILLARHTQNSSSRESSFSGGITTAGTPSMATTRSDIAIPEIEAKLGVTYIKPMDRGFVSFSTGWSVVNYFSLFGTSDLTLSGPFLQGKWVA